MNSFIQSVIPTTSVIPSLHRCKLAVITLGMPFARCCLTVVITLALGVSTAADEPQADAIRATIDAQARAWNDGDLEGFMKGYLPTEDLVFTSGSRVRRGWETTYTSYREHYGNAPETMGQLSFSKLEVHPLGSDAAWVLGRWDLEFSDGNRAGGIFTLVMQKLEDRWLVVHDHTSSDPN